MAYRILVSAPLPLVLIRVLNWVGVGPRDLGRGLTNFSLSAKSKRIFVGSKTSFQ